MPKQSHISLHISDFTLDSEPEHGQELGGFVEDPEQIFDELPQPYRMIDKTVNYVFDKVWEAIMEAEVRRNEAGVSGRLPVYDCAKKLDVNLPWACPNLISCTSDGKYVLVVAKSGVLYAIDANSSVIVATNEELHGLSILSISTCILDESKYLVSTLQENGSAAIFALSANSLHLMKVFNEETGMKNSVTTYVKLSFEGSFIAVGWSVDPRSDWLEVYKVPKELWINEINIITEQLKRHTEQLQNGDIVKQNAEGGVLKNDSSDSENESDNSRAGSPVQDGANTSFVAETSFTKPTMVLKVKAPSSNAVPNLASNAPLATKGVDLDAFPIGSNHILLQEYFDNSYATFKHHHQEYLEYLGDTEEAGCQRLPNVHFLTPGKFVPVGFNKTPEQVNSVVVHWSHNRHGSLYSLVKNTKETERKPDVVLATSANIIVSCASASTKLVSFYLENNNIVTWNILEGCALNTIHLSNPGSIISLHFLPHVTTKQEDNSRLIQLVACSENGSLHIINYNQNNGTYAIKSTPSSFKAKDPVIQLAQVPNIPQLVIVQRKSGRIAIIDTTSSTAKCQVGLIKPMTLLQGFSFVHQTSTLFIKGGKKDEYDEEILREKGGWSTVYSSLATWFHGPGVPDDEETTSAAIFTMNIDKFPTLAPYYKQKMLPQENKGRNFTERVENMDRNRRQSRDTRERQRKARWRQFEGELNRKKATPILDNSTWFSTAIKT